jgi:serine/threonine protein phosphatase PrpC
MSPDCLLHQGRGACCASAPTTRSARHASAHHDALLLLPQQGGWVAHGRVLHILAVARSLGDRDFKYEASLAAGMPITADLVSASPEVRSKQLKCLPTSLPPSPSMPASISKHASAHHGALASPQVRICRVQQGDELLLACDGLWDVLSGEAAFEYLHSHGAAESPQRAVSLLVQAADEQFNSLDNITACYVRLSTAE